MVRKSAPDVNPVQLRIDRWLWVARFFKTRALASAAVKGGKVDCNDVRVKPARMVKAGDRLEISRGMQRLEVIVEALSARRGPASAAAELYSKTDASIARRQTEQEARQLTRASKADYGGRPDKRARRRIRSFTGKGEQR